MRKQIQERAIGAVATLAVGGFVFTAVATANADEGPEPTPAEVQKVEPYPTTAAVIPTATPAPVVTPVPTAAPTEEAIVSETQADLPPTTEEPVTVAPAPVAATDLPPLPNGDPAPAPSQDGDTTESFTSEP